MTFPVQGAKTPPGSGNLKFDVRQAEEQTGFRQRFREHYGDVCAALQPYTLTIFIDDLDRCDAAKAAEMLEAANYLSDAGQCFLVLGMAKGIVEAQLGDVYKDIAERHAAFAALDQTAGNAATDGGDGKLRAEADRRDYARNYLRKLIQIEVPVPQFSASQLKALLADAGESQRDARAWDTQWLRARTHVRKAAAMAGYILALALTASVLAQGLRWGEQAGVKAREQADKAAALRFARIEEHRQVALRVAAYRAWLKAARLAADKAHKAAAAEADAAHYAHREDVEARWQRLRVVLDSLERAAAAGAGKDFERAETDVTRNLKAFNSMATADKWQEDKQAAKPAAAEGDQGKQLAERSSGQTSNDGRPLVEPPDPDTVPQWPYWVPIGLLSVLGIWAVYRSRDRYRIEASDDYKRALAAWQPLLLADEDRRAPREARRFLNLSRYLTLRINADLYARRSWLQRRLGEWRGHLPRDAAEKRIDEALLVGMTALYLARPASAPDGFAMKHYLNKPEQVLPDDDLLRAIRNAQRTLPNGWQPTKAEIDMFLRTVGELAD